MELWRLTNIQTTRNTSQDKTKLYDDSAAGVEELSLGPEVCNGHVQDRTALILALGVTVDQLFSQLPLLPVPLRLLDTDHFRQRTGEEHSDQL